MTMNGYDQHSTTVRARQTPLNEAGDSRSDGQASQTRDKANRYDTSTPERRRKALAAARRSANPADEARVRKQINEEANSTIDALMLGLNMNGEPVRRDNRATRRGGYRTKMTVEAKGDLPPWLRDKDNSGLDDDSDTDDGEKSSRSGGKSLLSPRRRMAESPLSPQIKPRDTVNWNGVEEAELTTKKRNALPKSDFALPGGRYPIPDETHARNALARVAQNGSPEEIAKVRAAVRRKFPDIEVSGERRS